MADACDVGWRRSIPGDHGRRISWAQMEQGKHKQRYYQHDRKSGKNTPEEIRIHTLLLRAIPEERHRRGNDPCDVFAVGSNRKVLSSKDKRYAVVGRHLDLRGEPFLLCLIRSTRPGSPEGFEPLIARPAKPRLVRTPTRHAHVDERVKRIGSNP